jgi:excisionase family DNA binding protein
MTTHLSGQRRAPAAKLKSTDGSCVSDREDRVVLDDLPPLLTVREVARLLRRSEAGTYAWLRAGGLRHLRVQGTIRVLKVDIEAFMSGRSTAGGPAQTEATRVIVDRR